MTEDLQSLDTPALPTVAVVEGHVRARVERLERAAIDKGHRRHSATVADLARLRRASAADPSDPSVWEAVFADAPKQILGREDQLSRAERATHAALVLFATHIQSADGPRHARGQRLGLAVGRLARTVDPEHYASSSVARRFKAFATATTFEQAVTHLRGLVTLLRSRGIALDYGALGADLYRIQSAEGLRRARLTWGRDFHFVKSDTDPISAGNASSSKEN